jgi:hypothetical protein
MSMVEFIERDGWELKLRAPDTAERNTTYRFWVH